MNNTTQDCYDRAEELKQFDDSKHGVKGLADSGITTIPSIFIHPPETLSDLKPKTRPDSNLIIPTVDLSDLDYGRRPEIVNQVSNACRKLGFFQITNHGIPIELLDRMIEVVKGFHELPVELKKPHYRRAMGRGGVSFFSNHDLFHSKAAGWRDTLYVKMGPVSPDLEEIPKICRNEMVEWNLEIKKIAGILMELLCEGLGVNVEKLKEMTCFEGNAIAGHYYPPCPQPDLTFGITSHTDPGVLTVLLQDHIGGLQIKHDGEWLDVNPVHGALVINVGDLLQIMSNDEYVSVEHRVLANYHSESRVSIIAFLGPGSTENLYGPLPELLSPEKPALYKQILYSEYIRTFFLKEADTKTLLNYYRV